MIGPTAWRGVFRALLVVVPLSVAGNLGLALWKTDFGSLPPVAVLKPGWLAAAAALGFIPWFTAAARLRRWTVFLKKPLTFSRCLHIAMGSELGSAATPTVMGGGYLKLGMLVQDGYTAGGAAALMVTGSVEDALAMSLTVPAAFAAAGGVKGLGLERLLGLRGPAAAAAGAVCGVVALAAIILVRRRRRSGAGNHSGARREGVWRRFISDFRSAASLAGGRGRGVFAGNTLLAAVHWTARYTVVSAFFAFLDLPVKPAVFFIFQWMAYALGALIVTPGGMVGLEAVFFVLFGPFVPTGLIGLATAGWRLMTSHLQLIAAAFLFLGAELRAGRPRRGTGDGSGFVEPAPVLAETGG